MSEANPVRTGHHYPNLPGVSIHPQALVETTAIGEGTRIWAFAHILEGASVGADCNICDHTFIEGGVTLGNRVTVKCGVYLWDGVRCENGVFLGPNATFTNDLYPRSGRHLDAYPVTLIREGASIGAGAVIRAGVTVGCYAMVGMGAVVTRDVPDYALVYGNPARLQHFISRAGRKLEIHGKLGTCPETGQQYRIENGVCRLLEPES